MLSTIGGYGRTISHVVIGLKTTKGSKQLRLDPRYGFCSKLLLLNPYYYY
jgi:hypothetical protein